MGNERAKLWRKAINNVIISKGKIKNRRNRDQNNIEKYDMIEFQKEILFGSINPQEEHQYRQKWQRQILAIQIDEFAAFPFREYLYKMEYIELIRYISVWIDIDKL